MSERFRLPNPFNTIPDHAVTVEDGKIVRVKDVTGRNFANQRRIEEAPKVNHSVYERKRNF